MSEEVLRAAQVVVELARQGEVAYHLYPSFDRPVGGCRVCAAIAAYDKALDPNSGAQEGER